MAEEERADIVGLVARGDAAALEAALAQGGDADARNRWGVSALAIAAGRGDLAAIEVLLAHGADVNRASDAGNTPLMAAAARGHLELLERLLAAGADPGRRNKWDQGAEDWGRWPDNAGEVLALLRSRGE